METLKLPFTATLLAVKVILPPDNVKPPLNVCAALEGVYVPPLTVVNPVTVVV